MLFFEYYGNGSVDFAIRRFLYQMKPEWCDLLRIRGYAVDWAGLSVEKQIEYVWIKLKTQ